MKNIGLKFATMAFLISAAASPSLAGKGGSAGSIRQAVASHSADAIIAEVERTEGLGCEECIQLVTQLTEDSRFSVREVAAWWFAKRPTLQKMMAEQFEPELVSGSSIQVRNAADFLGSSSTFTALPRMRQAILRTDLDADAKLALVRAVDHLGNLGGNPVLTTAMADASALVRAAAVKAWRDVRGQANAAPVVALLNDGDANVRAEAATVVGAMTETGARAALENLAISDDSAIVRRNASWALGKLGSAASRVALTQASHDPSGLVRMTARAALAQLH
ncbi:MAG: lyase domain protein repeat-containing protein [Deltaproteobacteria bacterium]|nr:lyase domain protein repeat-containing protein [Deltaproteobacteria bacterium]